MNKLINNRNLAIVNFAIVTFFGLIWLINHYQIDWVLVGVFREILTIPFLIAQLLFLVIGVINIIKQKPSILFVISLIALAVCSFVTISSFF